MFFRVSLAERLEIYRSGSNSNEIDYIFKSKSKPNSYTLKYRKNTI